MAFGEPIYFETKSKRHETKLIKTKGNKTYNSMKTNKNPQKVSFFIPLSAFKKKYQNNATTTTYKVILNKKT